MEEVENMNTRINYNDISLNTPYGDDDSNKEIDNRTGVTFCQGFWFQARKMLT